MMSFTHLITLLIWRNRLQLYKSHHLHSQTSDTHTFFPSYMENDKLIFRHLLKVFPFCTEFRAIFLFL